MVLLHCPVEATQRGFFTCFPGPCLSLSLSTATTTTPNRVDVVPLIRVEARPRLESIRAVSRVQLLLLGCSHVATGAIFLQAIVIV